MLGSWRLWAVSKTAVTYKLFQSKISTLTQTCTVKFLLMSNIWFDLFNIKSNCWHRISSSPKLMAREITIDTSKLPCNRDCTLPLNIANNLRYWIFWRYTYYHMHMIQCHVPLQYLATSMRCKFMKHWPKYFLIFPNNIFLLPLGMNITWYLQSHIEWLKLSYDDICIIYLLSTVKMIENITQISSLLNTSAKLL